MASRRVTPRYQLQLRRWQARAISLVIVLLNQLFGNGRLVVGQRLKLGGCVVVEQLANASGIDMRSDAGDVQPLLGENPQIVAALADTGGSLPGEHATSNSRTSGCD